MKRLIILLFVMVLMTSVLPIASLASDNTEEYVIMEFEDGSYMTEYIISSPERASGSKSGSKNKTYYDSHGDAKWMATISGTFTYTGSTSTCTAASCSVTIYDSDWYTISKSAIKSGNTATANVTIGEKLLGVKVNEVSTSVSLKCDANGNLS